MNKGFRKKEENMYLYHPLIKICYEGIRKKFLNYKINKKLYICSLIWKKELEKVIKKNRIQQKNKRRKS